MISTLELVAINAHDAEVEVFMKVHWRFNDLAGAIKRGQLELWDPTGDASSADLTASMSKTGIPEGTLVRGALPRRALPAAWPQRARR
jgi:hypothetical protein